MNLNEVKAAKWTHTKGIAQLIGSNQRVLITIKFGRRLTEVNFENRILQIKKTGFWQPIVTISEGQNVLLKQEATNIWKSLWDVRIGGNRYTGKQKMLCNYSVVYRNAQGFEVLSYEMNAWRWKSSMAFKVRESAPTNNDTILLLILGYYSLRKMKQESEAAAIASVAVVGS